MPKPESVLEKKMHKISRGLEIQKVHLIPTRRQIKRYLIKIKNKKKEQKNKESELFVERIL